jgi:hypothetical protein
MNNTLFLWLLFVPLFASGQDSTIKFTDHCDICGRTCIYMTGATNTELSKTIYSYTQENEQCAEFKQDGHIYNVEVFPGDTISKNGKWVCIWPENGMYLLPAIALSGEILILQKNNDGTIGYYPVRNIYYLRRPVHLCKNKQQ